MHLKVANLPLPPKTRGWGCCLVQGEAGFFLIRITSLVNQSKDRLRVSQKTDHEHLLFSKLYGGDLNPL